MAYDLDGNLISKTVKSGKVIQYSYNGNNKLTSESFEGDNSVFTYDGDDLLIRATDNDSEIVRNYDVFGRINYESGDHYNGHLEYFYNERGEKERVRLHPRWS